MGRGPAARRQIKRFDLWSLFGRKVEKVWRCKSGVTDVMGECTACPAEQGEVCQRHRVEEMKPNSTKEPSQ